MVCLVLILHCIFDLFFLPLLQKIQMSHAVFNPLLICLFATHIAGLVFSIIGLRTAVREKLKGKGFSIATIVIFLVELAIIILIFGLLLMIALGG